MACVWVAPTLDQPTHVALRQLSISCHVPQPESAENRPDHEMPRVEAQLTYELTASASSWTTPRSMSSASAPCGEENVRRPDSCRALCHCEGPPRRACGFHLSTQACSLPSGYIT